MLAKETLMQLENSLVVSGNVNWKSKEFNGKAIGNVVNVVRPIAVLPTRNNMAWVGSNSSVQQTRVPFAINRSLTQPLSFTQGDLSLKLDQFSKRILTPIIATMAAMLDADVCDAISNSTNPALSATQGFDSSGLNSAGDMAGTPSAAGYVVGTFGTALTTATIMLAKRYLIDVSCPQDGDIVGFLSSKGQSDINQAQATLFNPLMNVDRVYKAGEIGDYAGIRFYTTQSVATHLNGALASVAVTSGTLTSGWAESAAMLVTSSTGIQLGDMFQAPTQLLVNPFTKFVGTLPAQFQVVAIPDGTHITVSPAPISAGPYKNISATIDGATLTLVGGVGTSGQESLIFHKSALGVASIDLPVDDENTTAVNIRDKDADGFIIRYIKAFDSLGVSGIAGAGGVGLSGPASVRRFDVGWGCKVLNTALVVRVRC
jgi:hypothetical protein